MKQQFKRLFLCSVILSFSSLASFSFAKPIVDTIEVYSAKMQRTIKNVVILPDGYNQLGQTNYPVLYLLHGYGGNHSTWVSHTKKNLPQKANEFNMIVVCPDGDKSWYWDSPIDSKSQFETYVTNELVSHIDKNYRTITHSKGRAVTGFSMGGHGGLWLGINHQTVFGACGSMSGGVDIRPFPKNWSIAEKLGSYTLNKQLWDDHTIIAQLNKIESGKLAIIFDCGTNDFFFDVNETLHNEMVYRNIQHDYIVRPGGHDHNYWSNAIDYQMLYFHTFFNKK